MTDLDKLIAMLEPNAEENTVLFVRSEIARLLRDVHNNHIPIQDTATEVADDWSTTGQGEMSGQQRVDVYGEVDINSEWNPNDPRNW